MWSHQLTGTRSRIHTSLKWVMNSLGTGAQLWLAPVLAYNQMGHQNINPWNFNLSRLLFRKVIWKCKFCQCLTVIISYGKTVAWYFIMWQELFAGMKLTPVQLPCPRHIIAHSTRDLASSMGPATVSCTNCQPVLYIPVEESRVSIGLKRGSNRGSIGIKHTCMHTDATHGSFYVHKSPVSMQGRSQDLKLGVAQMDLIIWKPGGHIYFKYTTITITHIYIYIYQLRYTSKFQILRFFLFQQAPYTILL